MTYEKRTITICDHCGVISLRKRQDWQVGTRYDDEGRVPVHLCSMCQVKVYYCQICEGLHPRGEQCPVPAEEEDEE